MPVMVNDWLSSTSIALMSPAEEGAYFRLLCHAWSNADCCLPDDHEALARLSRLGPLWADGLGEKIRRCFESDPLRPGFIFNSRQREIRQKQMERIEAARGKCAVMREAKAMKRVSYKESLQESLETDGKSLTKGLSSPVTPLPSPDSHIMHGPAKPDLSRCAGRQDCAFVQPSIEEVFKYAAVIGKTRSEAEWFFNHYESIGWLHADGKQVKYWKRALRYWKPVREIQ